MTKFLLVALFVAACGKGNTGPGTSSATSGSGGAPGAIGAPGAPVEDNKPPAVGPEGRMMLNRLGKDARRHVGEVGTYPVGSAPLTPTTDCCKAADHTCPADPTAWAGEPWKTLDFSIDSPGRFRFSYDGAADGKSFTATAVAELDCDGKLTTWTAKGSVDAAGKPTVDITPK